MIRSTTWVGVSASPNISRIFSLTAAGSGASPIARRPSRTRRASPTSSKRVSATSAVLACSSALVVLGALAERATQRLEAPALALEHVPQRRHRDIARASPSQRVDRVYQQPALHDDGRGVPTLFAAGLRVHLRDRRAAQAG